MTKEENNIALNQATTEEQNKYQHDNSKNTFQQQQVSSQDGKKSTNPSTPQKAIPNSKKHEMSENELFESDEECQPSVDISVVFSDKAAFLVQYLGSQSTSLRTAIMTDFASVRPDKLTIAADGTHFKPLDSKSTVLQIEIEERSRWMLLQICYAARQAGCSLASWQPKGGPPLLIQFLDVMLELCGGPSTQSEQSMQTQSDADGQAGKEPSRGTFEPNAVIRLLEDTIDQIQVKDAVTLVSWIEEHEEYFQRCIKQSKQAISLGMIKFSMALGRRLQKQGDATIYARLVLMLNRVLPMWDKSGVNGQMVVNHWSTIHVPDYMQQSARSTTPIKFSDKKRPSPVIEHAESKAKKRSKTADDSKDKQDKSTKGGVEKEGVAEAGGDGGKDSQLIKEQSTPSKTGDKQEAGNDEMKDGEQREGGAGEEEEQEDEYKFEKHMLDYGESNMWTVEQINKLWSTLSSIAHPDDRNMGTKFYGLASQIKIMLKDLQSTSSSVPLVYPTTATATPASPSTSATHTFQPATKHLPMPRVAPLQLSDGSFKLTCLLHYLFGMHSLLLPRKLGLQTLAPPLKGAQLSEAKSIIQQLLHVITQLPNGEHVTNTAMQQLLIDQYLAHLRQAKTYEPNNKEQAKPPADLYANPDGSINGLVLQGHNGDLDVEMGSGGFDEYGDQESVDLGHKNLNSLYNNGCARHSDNMSLYDKQEELQPKTFEMLVDDLEMDEDETFGTNKLVNDDVFQWRVYRMLRLRSLSALKPGLGGTVKDAIESYKQEGVTQADTKEEQEAQPANDQAQPAIDQTQPANDQTQPDNDQAQPANDQAQPANDQAQHDNDQQQVQGGNVELVQEGQESVAEVTEVEEQEGQ